MGLVGSTCLHAKGRIIIDVCVQATVELRVSSSCDSSLAEGVEEEDLFEAAGFAPVKEDEMKEPAPLDGVLAGAFFRVSLEPWCSPARSSLVPMVWRHTWDITKGLQKGVRVTIGTEGRSLSGVNCKSAL